MSFVVLVLIFVAVAHCFDPHNHGFVADVQFRNDPARREKITEPLKMLPLDQIPSNDSPFFLSSLPSED